MTETGQFDTLKDSIITAMQDRKAIDITSIDLRKLNNSMTDMFIICHGTSGRQVEAISESVEEVVKKEINLKPSVKEGENNKEWILLDYFDIIVHIFQEDRREFFSLEELWGDGIVEKYSND